MITQGSALLAPLLAVALGTSWLDEPRPRNWNRPAAPLPSARNYPGPPSIDDECKGAVRRPATAEETAVTQAGWAVLDYERPLRNGRLTTVTAASDVSGQCRPYGFQVFVFYAGQFAGTISPQPMDARADGSGGVTSLRSPLAFQAEFSRYADSDPACCPSRKTLVQFVIRFPAGKPVVVPVSAATSAQQ